MAYISMLTDDSSIFLKYLQGNTIPCMQNDDFKVQWEKPKSDTLYIMKWQKGCSFMDSMEQDEACQALDTCKSRMRQFYVNQQTLAKNLSSKTQNSYYQDLLACLDDQDFVGIMMCNTDIDIKQEERLGTPSLLQLFSFQVPFLKLESVVFSGELAEVSNAQLYGFMSSVEKEKKHYTDDSKFHLYFQQMGSGLGKTGFKNPYLIAELALYQLFGREAETRSSLELYGMYNRVESATGSLYTYRFFISHYEELYMPEGSLEGVTIEQAVVGYEEQNGTLILDLNCTGRLFFRKIQENFDAFGYGYRTKKTNEEMTVWEAYLKYQGLHLEFTLSKEHSVMTVNYKNIRLTEQSELLLEDAIYAQLPHEPLEFICHQSASQLEKLGYHQIDVPVRQEKLSTDAEWYGILMPVILFHGVIIQVVFVFSNKTGFSAYGKTVFGKNNAGISVSSLMELEAKDILLYREPGQAVRLMLKGLKVSLFGWKLPEGSVNVALLPDEKGQMCWFCLYEK